MDKPIHRLKMEVTQLKLQMVMDVLKPLQLFWFYGSVLPKMKFQMQFTYFLIHPQNFIW